MKRFFFAISLFSLSSLVFADPLPDAAFMPNKAGWFPSLATPCPQVCFNRQATAEHEDYFVSSGHTIIRKSFVCKVKARNAQGELYGNNFYDNALLKKQCTVVDHLGKVYSEQQFLCLCVQAPGLGPINPPEPPPGPPMLRNF
ncbi:MAG: hypothetical protein HQK50_09575 [Oligoflexia bacterium]|nr:hypothetical protein [Oligoflexia bacterium]MBF0365811.1 hypothetical protein [Oligoflexia bacterium]